MAEPELDKDIAKIAKGAGITAIGEMSFYLLSFISTIITTNILGRDLFGLLTLTYVILYLGRIFSGLGLYSGVIRFISIFKARTKARKSSENNFTEYLFNLDFPVLPCPRKS